MTLTYDSIAASYDRRYLVNDYSGVDDALLAFVGRDLPGQVLEVGRAPFCINALHHFDDKPAFFAEARRVLARSDS